MKIKNLSAFTSKSDLRPALASVRVTPSHVIATDSFKLIEIQSSLGSLAGIREGATIKLPKGLKTFDELKQNGDVVYKGATYTTTPVEEQYPEYEHLFPEGEPEATITLDPEHLKELCIAFACLGPIAGQMQINVYGKNKPVILMSKDKTVRAMLAQIAS